MAIRFRRSSGETGPIWPAGDTQKRAPLLPAYPSHPRKEINASPTSSCVIAVATSSFGVRSKCLRSRFHRFLIARSERPQCMLHSVTKLPEHSVRNVYGFRVTKLPNAHTFRTNQTHDLFNLCQKSWRRICEEQVRLVKEEYKFRFVQISTSGSRSKSSESSHSKNVAYSCGD